ncbi:hypothetical protein ACWDOR_45345, partial [Streptosporangium canum]
QRRRMLTRTRVLLPSRSALGGQTDHRRVGVFLAGRPGADDQLLDRPAGVEPIGRAFRQAVAAFVRTGNPNTPGVPAWEAYTELRRCTMRFDTFVTAANDPAYSERRLLLPSRRHSSGSAETSDDDS